MRSAPNGLAQGTAGQTFLSGDDGQLCELACFSLSLSVRARACKRRDAGAPVLIGISLPGEIPIRKFSRDILAPDKTSVTPRSIFNSLNIERK